MNSKSLATINGQSLSEKDFISSIDNELVLLNDTGNINHTLDVLNRLDKVDDVVGHAKAKLLWGTNEWWKINRPTENFSDQVESITKIRKVTVDRYITVWNYVEDYTIPKEFHSLPMRDLVPIAKAVQYMKLHDKDLSKKDWQKISTTSNSAELSSVLQEIKGKKPKKNTKVIKLSRDGSLNLWKNNVKKFVGFLNVKDAETDIEIAEAIEKIIVSTGIVRE